GLPLALELAGAFLRHRSIGWGQYRDLLNQNLKAALPARFLASSFTQHESDLYSTLKVDEQILSEEPILREVLDVLTWSGPGPMGKSLLEAVLGPRALAGLEAALALGVELRLLQKTPGADNYALHRLVREVRREDEPLTARPDWAAGIADNLGLWFRKLKRDFADLPRFEAEIDHLRVWQEHIQSIRPATGTLLVWLQAYPPFHRGRYMDARALLEQARLSLEQSRDPDLILQADVLSDLCTIHTTLGFGAEARQCGEAALEIRLKLFGEHHSETAMTCHNLAGALTATATRSDPSAPPREVTERALALEQKALGIWLETSGEDHIDTALALDAISQDYVYLAKYEDALAYAERGLAVRERVLG
ncbi:MAG: tetratricopeptide repeat protein, partial [Candidatus Dormibacteraceae bacterium]